MTSWWNGESICECTDGWGKLSILRVTLLHYYNRNTWLYFASLCIPQCSVYLVSCLKERRRKFYVFILDEIHIIKSIKYVPFMIILLLTSCLPLFVCVLTGNQQKPYSRDSQSANSSPNPNTPQTQTNQELVSADTSSLPNQISRGESAGGGQIVTKGQSTTTATTTQHQNVKHPQSTPGAQSVPTTSSSQLPPLQPPSFFANSPNPSDSSTVHREQKPPTAMAVNSKQVLNIHCQKNHIPLVYDCMASEDSVGYIATVKTSGRVFESSPHGTKKAAEAAAAEKAVKALGLMGPSHADQHGGGSGYSHHGGGGGGYTASATHAQSE